MKKTTQEDSGYMEQIVNQTIIQGNHQLILERIAFSTTDTKIYLKGMNNSPFEFNLLLSDSKILQETNLLYPTNEKTIMDDTISILNNQQKNIVLVYPPMSPKTLSLSIPATSDDPYLAMGPYVFNVNSDLTVIL